MNLWFDAAGLFLLAALGVFLGRTFSRLKSSAWLIGFGVPLLFLILVGLTRYFYLLTFVVPFSWVTAGRLEFVLSALMIPMLLTTPLLRSPRKPLRFLLKILMVVAVMYYSILPMMAPYYLREDLTYLETTVLSGGYVLQSTVYTCGPAAAATALRQLGVEATEIEIAILSYANPISGTPDDVLCSALQKRYSDEGILCERRPLRTIEELKEAGLTLAVIKYSPQFDHYVTVLEVTDDRVLVADPLIGRTSLSHAEFMKRWRRSGIVLKRIL